MIMPIVQDALKNAAGALVIGQLKLDDTILNFLGQNPTLAPFCTGATYVVLKDAVQAVQDGGIQGTLLGSGSFVDAADKTGYYGIALFIFEKFNLLRQLHDLLIPLNIVQLPESTFGAVVEGTLITICDLLRMYLPGLNPNFRYITNPIRMFVPA